MRPGKVVGDLAVDAHHRALRDREYLGVERVLVAGLLVVAVHLHLLAHVLLEQLLGAQEIVAVVLLEDVQVAREGLDAHRLRLDLLRDVAELERRAAPGEIHGADLADEAEVLVVDGDAHLVALLRRGLGLRGRGWGRRGRGEAGRGHDRETGEERSASCQHHFTRTL